MIWLSLLHVVCIFMLFLKFDDTCTWSCLFISSVQKFSVVHWKDVFCHEIAKERLLGFFIIHMWQNVPKTRILEGEVTCQKYEDTHQKHPWHILAKCGKKRLGENYVHKPMHVHECIEILIRLPVARGKILNMDCNWTENPKRVPDINGKSAIFSKY